MSFRLKNVRAAYQCLVNKIFEPLLGKTMEVCVDDMIVKSKQDAEHARDLLGAFESLRRYGIKLNHKNCTFGVR